MAWPPKTHSAGMPGTRDLPHRFGSGEGRGGLTLLPFIKAGHRNPAIEQLPSSSSGVVTADGSGVEVKSDNCRIFTGTYTGDGTASQVITCAGAGSSSTIRYVRIWQRQTSDNTALAIWESTREINDDIAAGLGVSPSYQVSGEDITGMSFVADNTIIALGTDGTFTVDDSAADSHPNKNSQVYNYMALGS